MDGPTTHLTQNPPPVADAPAGNWVDRYAPAAWRPYLRLARLDRPIGTWLLLFPCWWSLALAEVSRLRPYPDLWYLVLFAVGALVMRGAGCAYNDFVDREYDARVQRTRSRPIPSGQVTPSQALLYAATLALVGFLVLIQLNTFTVWLAIASLALIAVYPFMKRFLAGEQLGDLDHRLDAGRPGARQDPPCRRAGGGGGAERCWGHSAGNCT